MSWLEPLIFTYSNYRVKVSNQVKEPGWGIDISMFNFLQIFCKVNIHIMFSLIKKMYRALVKVIFSFEEWNKRIFALRSNNYYTQLMIFFLHSFWLFRKLEYLINHRNPPTGLNFLWIV